MTLQQFLEKWNGVYVEVAGTTAKNQCVDLANLYIRDVLGLPIIEWTNAVDFPSKVNSNDYDYILNTPEGVPQEGDLVIWGGTYGHIAIFIEGDTNRFTSFDQNYPTGTPCHIQEHTYLSPKVIGWLHCKTIHNPQVSVDSKTFEKLVANSTCRDQVRDRLACSDNNTIILAEVDKLLTMEKAVQDKDKQLADVQQTLLTVEQELLAKAKQLGDASSQVATLTVEVGNSQQTIQSLTQSYKESQKAISELKTQCSGYVKLTGFKKFIYDVLLKF